MKKFFQKYAKYIPNLIARGIKNFGFVCIGISICALIEIGVFWELIALSVISLAVTVLAYVMVKQTADELKSKLEEIETEGECQYGKGLR